MKARTDRQMSQNDVIDRLANYKGKDIVLQDRLYEAGQVAQRGERLQLIAETGLQHLDNPDVPAANAWLRQFFRVWVEGNEVFAVEIL